MADRLLQFVLSGTKRATCWSVAEGQQTEIGKQMVILDGNGQPRAIVETVELEQRRFCDVELQFALDEGEGVTNLEDWRSSHKDFFEHNGGFNPEMMLWCEHFRLVEVIGP